jgi:polar amino acid transport system substrate-binding protein
MPFRRCLLAATMLLAVALPAAAQDKLPPLRTAVDGTFAPHAFPTLDGGVQGFNIDLFRAIAKQMHREITIDSTSFSGLIPAMDAGRYDFIAAPVTVTPQRAENMLFTEGYLWTEFQFGIRKGSKPITSLDDLKGKVITLNKGSAYETWARANADKYGFTWQGFDTNTDAISAVLAGRAYANLSGNTGIKYAATKNPLFVADYVLKDTRAQWAAPFRKDEVALRDQVEMALECLKLDGTVVKLSEKWFGGTPAPDDLERVVEPGFGVPGMPGYDPTPHTPKCS